MGEESKEKDHPYINEIIISKKQNKWLLRLETLGIVIVMAVIFGFVARWAFLSSDGYLRELLGVEEERQKVDLPRFTVDNDVTSSTDETQGTVVHQNLVPTILPIDGKNSYINMYEEIRQLSQHISNSIAIVEVIEQGVDWFQQTYETKTWTTGVVLAQDGVHLLILTDLEKISKENLIQVYFGEAKVSGQVYAIDKDYGLAIIAVTLSNISKEVFQQITFARFEEDAIIVGTPILALGGPNGYKNSMEVGMVTSLGDNIGVVDGELSYFTTNVTDYMNGNGFIFNFSGEVMGMITHTHKKNREDAVCSAIYLEDIRSVIVSLLNNTKQTLFGIKGQDVPESYPWLLKDLSELSGVKGVFVTEVQNDSPALKAGIKAGDIILAVNGKQVEGIMHWKEILLECIEGESIQVTFYKNLENQWIETKVQVKLVGKK